MARIRKEHAGSDSFGHVWPEDGAVVNIDDHDQIASLMAIPDGGFSEVAPEQRAAKAKPAAPAEELSEIDPDAPDGEPGDDKPTPRKTAAKRPGRKPASLDVQE